MFMDHGEGGGSVYSSLKGILRHGVYEDIGGEMRV